MQEFFSLFPFFLEILYPLGRKSFFLFFFSFPLKNNGYSYTEHGRHEQVYVTAPPISHTDF